ncbi:hypothetical protein MCOR07_004041 [Pyricularia oryzae]|uniref:Uncharacterized protein n=2 Tax=Pyricularia TaxID=48558 RepID=A0ABQ8NKD2_PYRGI|nr:hypothetical protein MCOR01_007772 [Pyricularia oryzae]KAI6298435.1 hypothetical protein MCOR33_005421 [Pyricularia grisea]KAI6257511.1 hypothetical protein MCOR19_006050 [Pyricularia oryzae]KAI6286929.1 hypothetical protein MCOR26_000906 [Pyricularia oryzae]KAI6295669.1 hypothetical protein MCOR34_009580 [Pyricularia oryzae]
MPAAKPKLASLTTPVSASFPADAIASAVSSAKTPLSAVLRDPLASAGLPSAGLPSAGMVSPFGTVAMVKTEEAMIKTPISPPVAYIDFLRLASPTSMPSPSVLSPPLTAGATKSKLSRTSTSDSTNSNSTCKTVSSDEAADDAGDRDLVDSGPSTATSEDSECSCDCDHTHKSPLNKCAVVPSSPFAVYPLSAPATGQAHFPSLKVPPSPAKGNVDSPVQSPFSARSVKSPFDWEAALKARRYADAAKTNNSGHRRGCSKSTSATNSRTSVRHIREVVTRTVTYTPKMDPAPKGKRRKVQ